MIALCIVTHPKTFLFLQNFIDSLLQDGCWLPPVYIVAGDVQGYTTEQIEEIQQLCCITDGDLFTWKVATWEAGAIQVLNQKLPPEVTEFVFLQDTFEFKPDQFQLFWERIKESHQKTLWFTHNCQMYAGKFRREVLDKMEPWPWPTCKAKAIQMERAWQDNYNQAEDSWLIYKWPGIPDGIDEFEKCGRLNVRCENEYFIKWKGTHTGNLHRRLQEIDEEGKL